MFQNRTEAAKRLSTEIFTRHGSDLDLENTIVLGLPRGGVPMAKIIADDLTVPLNIIISKKIGHPMNPEYAIGAVTELGDEIFDEAEKSNLGEIQLADAKQKTLDKINKYKNQLRPGSKAEFPNIEGKTVILVDDGIATGKSILAAIESLKKARAEKVIVAVPVSARDSADKVKKAADEFICLQRPPFFMAVGQFYKEFNQVQEEKVKEILISNR